MNIAIENIENKENTEKKEENEENIEKNEEKNEKNEEKNEENEENDEKNEEKDLKKKKKKKKKSKKSKDDGDDLLDTFSSFAKPNAIEKQQIQRLIEDDMLKKTLGDKQTKKKKFELTDICSIINDGTKKTVEDTFSVCFKQHPPKAWNWNGYLYVLWVLGVFVRYGILFPLRLLVIIVTAMVLPIVYLIIRKLNKNNIQKRQYWECKLIRWLCSAFVLSWTGVIQYHGVVPKHKPNQIYVANHSSMIDMIILQQMTTFSLVGQQHKGWVGYVQNNILSALKCLWFERGVARDRKKTGQQIKQHIENPDNNRLLLFPEGTCVNNKYCVQFKKGVFGMDSTICPIAIKYNDIFVDGYWNSRQQSFLMHLVSLMTSWAVVCDVSYLEPQKIRKGETVIEFTNRVKRMICKVANLKSVDWDGYMKYYQPSPRFLRRSQKIFAESILIDK